MKTKIFLGFIIVLLLINLGLALFGILSSNEEYEQPNLATYYDDLYDIYYDGSFLFINEDGDVVLRFSNNECDAVGTFIEGRAFISKDDREIEYDEVGADFYYKITYLTIID